MSKFLERFNVTVTYMPLLRQLVIRDLKLKYRRSFLGYAWSILNPLMVMSIMAFVLGYVFKANINNYPVYLLSGQLIFTFFNDSSYQAINSINGNASLLKKTYVPKYIFTISKVTSALVNTFFTLGALLIVMVFTGTHFSLGMLLIPFILLEVFIFNVGVGLFLAQANVFFRDTQYIWQAFTTALTYATPLFYPINMLPVNIKKIILIANPMASYVMQFRGLILKDQVFTPNNIIYGVFWAFFALFVGAYLFFKKQDKFILYI